MPSNPTILLAGGGSGGHIYPNLAVAERLAEMGSPLVPHLLISRRPLDEQIARGSGLGFTPIDASPLAMRPRALWRFGRDFRAGKAQVRRVLRQSGAKAVIATGGFVSGPAVSAAHAEGIPVALVSLDAVPGLSNRFTARAASAVFSAFPPHGSAKPLPGCRVIGYPLRRAAVSLAGGRRPPLDGSATEQIARTELGLRPDLPTLLVFAGSQGARTINHALMEMVGRDDGRATLDGWQLLHIAGAEGHEQVRAAYERAGLPGRVLDFCQRMDLAWAAADLGLTRAGAGTVAEAWANAVPCVMLPYPFHKDQHQRHNAGPVVGLGGAVVMDDAIDPRQNATRLVATLGPLMADADRRAAMRRSLRQHPAPDGAQALAAWAVQISDPGACIPETAC